MAKQDNEQSSVRSPLHTPKGLRDAKKDYATKYGRTANGAYRFGSAVSDPKNQEK